MKPNIFRRRTIFLRTLAFGQASSSQGNNACASHVPGAQTPGGPGEWHSLGASRIHSDVVALLLVFIPIWVCKPELAGMLAMQ